MRAYIIQVPGPNEGLIGPTGRLLQDPRIYLVLATLRPATGCACGHEEHRPNSGPCTTRVSEHHRAGTFGKVAEFCNCTYYQETNEFSPLVHAVFEEGNSENHVDLGEWPIAKRLCLYEGIRKAERFYEGTTCPYVEPRKVF